MSDPGVRLSVCSELIGSRSTFVRLPNKRFEPTP
jgi:hypothetical protein